MNFKEEGFHVFSGPNQFSDFPCVVFLFDSSNFNQRNNVIDIKEATELRYFFPENPYFNEIIQLAGCNIPELICELAKFIQTEQYNLKFQSHVGISHASIHFIALSYFSLRGAQIALQFALNLTRYVLKKDIGSKELFSERIKIILQEQKKLQPDQTQTMMLNAALDLKIPVYQYQDNNQFLCYGQGCHSVAYHSASSEFDSSIGVALQQDKYLTNQLLKTMGLPATELHLVRDFESAKNAALELTYPVVVKPVGQGQGFGVTANIQNEMQLKDAFNHAIKYRSYAVIVEKHVKGLDHRLVVANGKFIGAISRIPSTVVGDNKSTISELIVQENNKRSVSQRRKGLIKDILIDENLKILLSKFSYSLDSIPKDGEIIPLRSISNVSTGGVYVDVFDKVHPDIKQMALEVAKYFRLDVVGVDFLTSDISKSWREEGAINEINTTPMLFDNMARDLLTTKFLENFGATNDENTSSRCRIPTVLIIGDDKRIVDVVSQNLGFALEKIALVSSYSQAYYLNNSARKLDNKTINEKCLALISHPECRVLFVHISLDELISNGLPLDYFSYCYAGSNIIEKLPKWVNKNCGTITSV